MSHTIPVNKKISKLVTPIALYEGNYRRIIKLFPELIDANKQGNSGGMLWPLSDKTIRLKITEQYKYTCIVNLYKVLSEHSQINTVHMSLRICFDARLVEVISFQGSQSLKLYPVYPNKDMLLPDEKKQINLHLKQLLELSLNCLPEDRVLDMLLLKP